MVGEKKKKFFKFKLKFYDNFNNSDNIAKGLDSSFKIIKVRYNKKKTNEYNNLFLTNLNDISSRFDIFVQFFEVQQCEIKINKYYSFLESFSYSIFRLIYKIKKKEQKIKIFDKHFIQHNKDKCILLYNEKVYPIKELFDLRDIENIYENSDKLEILLVELKNIHNKSYMFADCISLEKYIKFNYSQDINKRIMSEYNEKYESIDNNIYNNFYYSNELTHLKKENLQSSFSLLDLPSSFGK